MKEKEIKFEKAMERLEECVGILEKGDAGLEESLKIYEEGMNLVKVLKKKMGDFEKRIEIIKKLNRTGYTLRDIREVFKRGISQE